MTFNEDHSNEIPQPEHFLQIMGKFKRKNSQRTEFENVYCSTRMNIIIILNGYFWRSEDRFWFLSDCVAVEGLFTGQVIREATAGGCDTGAGAGDAGDWVLSPGQGCRHKGWGGRSWGCQGRNGGSDLNTRIMKVIIRSIAAITVDLRANILRLSCQPEPDIREPRAHLLPALHFRFDDLTLVIIVNNVISCNVFLDHGLGGGHVVPLKINIVLVLFLLALALDQLFDVETRHDVGRCWPGDDQNTTEARYCLTRVL